MNLSAVKTRALRAYEKAAVMGTTGAVLLVGSPMVQAAGIDSLFDEIDLSGVSAKVTAAAVTIVAIAFLMKGPSIVKRLVSKI